MDGCEVFNVGRATHWAFANGLGVNPKADPETSGLAILNLRQVARPSLCQGTPRGIIWMGTWRTLNPRRLLHAPGAIRERTWQFYMAPVRSWGLYRLGNCAPFYSRYEAKSLYKPWELIPIILFFFIDRIMGVKAKISSELDIFFSKLRALAFSLTPQSSASVFRRALF